MRITASKGLDEVGKSNKRIILNRDITKWAHNRKILIRAIMAPNELKCTVNLVNNFSMIKTAKDEYLDNLSFITESREYISNLIKESRNRIENISDNKYNSEYEDLRKFEYIEAFLRIRPIIPTIGRESTSFDQISDYKIPSPNTTNDRCPSSEVVEDLLIKNTFLYFGGGLRMCPGRHLAMNYWFALLYKKYKFELVNDKLTLRQSIDGSQCG
ncbi:1199_t:CDS:2 [Entrophospora sp. SA101]|nr:1199_t:CDS:2 [Entrophospora sp. SA101]CAJ0862397.1 1532_t:CDS:2 [Entrophospora sp. SA101]CAJ0894204.1 10342_t:CDS:2 [Entrophospora sp. SA101]